MPGSGKGEGGRVNHDELNEGRTLPPSRVPLPREVKLSNLDKIFWPDEKYTKGDLIEYYRSMAPWLLPYLKDRPVVLTRYPDGINGKSFYQKTRPGSCPSGFRRFRSGARTPSATSPTSWCNDVESLGLSREPRHDPAAHVDEPDR